MTEKDHGPKCTACGHYLVEHESDEEEPKLYRKWCYAEDCTCPGYRDSNWEPHDTLGMANAHE